MIWGQWGERFSNVLLVLLSWNATYVFKYEGSLQWAGYYFEYFQFLTFQQVVKNKNEENKQDLVTPMWLVSSLNHFGTNQESSHTLDIFCKVY